MKEDLTLIAVHLLPCGSSLQVFLPKSGMVPESGGPSNSFSSVGHPHDRPLRNEGKQEVLPILLSGDAQPGLPL